jgi:recombination protein RecA
MLAGPSNSGKSFLAANTALSALNEGYGVLYIDSENAVDTDYLTAIGIDHENPRFMYQSTNTVAKATRLVQKFLKEYKSSGEEMPFVVIIDSLDMLQTESALDNYNKGKTVGDQGQQAKQLKKMLATFVQDLKGTNVGMICVKQPYANQDAIAALNEPYVITEGLKFAFHQILLVTKQVLKDKETKIQEGIKIKAYGYKTRFTKPFQSCIVEVPYDKGMNPYTGVLEAAVDAGIVEQKGAWYTFNDEKFQRKGFDAYREEVLEKLIENDDGDTTIGFDESEYSEVAADSE